MAGVVEVRCLTVLHEQGRETRIVPDVTFFWELKDRDGLEEGSCTVESQICEDESEGGSSEYETNTLDDDNEVYKDAIADNESVTAR